MSEALNSPSTNPLKNEKSPYLLQHRNNPVKWYPWGEEAFRLARTANKPIFLSIGYSTCHWCHVMAHECFEDQEVADALNTCFVSIKVDREERPDVDDIYMRALQALTGGGGWPMSVWLTPEGKPFFAGTYFPKYRFLQIVRRIHELWSSDSSQLRADSERLLAAVLSAHEPAAPEEDADADMEEFLKTYTNHFQYHFDERYGGFGGAPKFPQTMNLMLMMRQDFKLGLNAAEEIVTSTLRHMLRGGIYDHLQGGFHRYSVDERWLVPHFEKMLYDQALITVTLLDAATLYGQPEFARGARETLDYVLREMTYPGGGFYSAQDADSLNPHTGRNEEGYFATYTFEEIQSQVSATELEALNRVFGVRPDGQFEGRNILHLQGDYDGRAKDEPELQSAFEKLRRWRAARPAPHLDDKIIASWNGWMIWALARGARVLGEPRYLASAQAALRFVRENLGTATGLARFWRDGEAKAPGTSEDYNSVIHACLEVYQADFDPAWGEWAIELQSVLDRDFWDVENGGYFTNNGRDPLLPARVRDEYDGVSPCANSMGALNLNRLYLLTGEPQYLHRSRRIFSLLFPKLKESPSGLPFLAQAMDWSLSDPKVVVCSGEEGWVREFYRDHAARFHPYVFWAGAGTGWPVTRDKSTATPSIYICEEGQCLRPANTRSEAEAQLSR
ncbi:MAG: thioredoxin domain-containing protein [Bdellovibrionales bacterium]